MSVIAGNLFLSVPVTLLAGLLGVYIARKIKMPIPFMLGSMIAVAVFNILTNAASMPPNTKVFTQSMSGMFIGLSLTRKDLKGLKDLIEPALILVVCFLIFTTVVGFIMFKIAGFDAATAWLICVPGGVVDTSLMAYDLNADPAIVSFVQSFRLFSVYLIFPSLITYVSKRVPPEEHDPSADSRETVKVHSFVDDLIPDRRVARHILTAAVGIAGGIFGKFLGIPSGALSCSMICVILLNLTTNRAMFDRKYKRWVQVVAGALIGLSITMDTVRQLPSIIIPTCILIASYVLVNFLISWLMTLTKKIDFVSAMFASAPGGASDFALIASDIGGESPKIAIMHIVRLLAVYTIFPILVKFMISIFG